MGARQGRGFGRAAGRGGGARGRRHHDARPRPGSAGGVRGRHRADPGRVRDPHGRRIRAGDRLLRVHARAQADRGPDVSRRHEVHAVFDQRHGGVRRLHPRPQGHNAGSSRGDAAHPRRHPVRQLRARVDRRESQRGPPVRGAAPGGRGASDRAGGRQAARDDAVDGRGESGAGWCRGAACCAPTSGDPNAESRTPQGMTARTLFAKVWAAHVVHQFPEGPALLYVDLHLVHEVTSPQAFEGLRQAGRRVRRPALTVGTGTAGATGHVIEYTGEAIRALSMEERMTVCNMSIEAGARAGMIAPDETTVAYLAGRPRAPSGAAWDRAVAKWRELRTDPGATYDKRVELDASEVAPQVTWGTSPGMVTPVTGCVPSPADFTTDAERRAVTRALEYMGLAPGTPLEGLPIDRVFLGSCTNARIEDLRAAARTVRGRHVATGVRAMVVPGSQQVKAQAEREGLDRVFSEAGFEWRNAGCSMCLGMNPDVLQSGERCASTSNRNFEGRQGRGGRTHLMSPPMAAAAAVAGHIVDVRRWGAGGAGGAAP